jgi:flagellar basal-body rod protein FlgF
MMNAQLIGVSRQIALQRELSVIANNLANMNTTGYRSEQMAFEEYRMPIARASAFEPGDRTLAYVQDWTTIRDNTQGAITLTGNQLDVALDGEGYLVVETPQGVRYTRNGALQINPDGVLVTQSGHTVLGLDGPIVFEDTDTEIAISADGIVSTPDAQRGTLQIVRFDNDQALKKIGDNLYLGEGALPDEFTKVVQGAVERSNVESVREISRMVEVQRAYQLQARMVRDFDGLRRDAIGQLGRLNA